jgi:WD40 repeat protein
MARFRANRTLPLAGLFFAFLATAVSAPASAQSIYDHAILVADPGKHTAVIRSVAVDAMARFAVTGSEDKTIRVWNLNDPARTPIPVRTIRMPAGPGHIGKIFAVAITPNGEIIAAGGWTTGLEERESIYLFDRDTGVMISRITGLKDVVTKLVFSSDGRFLAAGLGGGQGLHLYDSVTRWREVFSDTNYDKRDSIYGITFTRDEALLATASNSGIVNLYGGDLKSTDGGDFRLINSLGIVASRGAPYQIQFRPDGNVLALGYLNKPLVDLLDGHTLQSLSGPDTEGLDGILPHVSWSTDGEILFAGGGEDIIAWSQSGRGERRKFPGGGWDRMTSLNALPDGGVVAATADPLLYRLKADGSMHPWRVTSPIADIGNQYGILQASANGMVVDFGYDQGKPSLRINLEDLKLDSEPPADRRAAPSKKDGLLIDHWKNGLHPTLNGQPIGLDPDERSRDFAISPDGRHFVLGTTRSLRFFDADNKQAWRDDVSDVWAVNITSDGKLVIATHDDGTVRWYNMQDGRELLALLVLPVDETNRDTDATPRRPWVAWTPEGFGAIAYGAFRVLQWHVNHGYDAPGTTFSLQDIRGAIRPDILPWIIQERDVVRVVGIAGLQELRRNVQNATRTEKPPGARLHVFTVGINDYGDDAKNLTLSFAKQDARDVATTLRDTQANGLYAQVVPQYLYDSTASRLDILKGLKVVAGRMEKGDLAVVMFAGHGFLDSKGNLYLATHGINMTGTELDREETALPADRLRGAIAEIAQKGRVLVLLDACHAGAFPDKSGRAPNVDIVRNVIDSANVTVFTSSTADGSSREDKGR